MATAARPGRRRWGSAWPPTPRASVAAERPCGLAEALHDALGGLRSGGAGRDALRAAGRARVAADVALWRMLTPAQRKQATAAVWLPFGGYVKTAGYAAPWDRRVAGVLRAWAVAWARQRWPRLAELADAGRDAEVVAPLFAGERLQVDELRDELGGELGPAATDDADRVAVAGLGDRMPERRTSHGVQLGLFG